MKLKFSLKNKEASFETDVERLVEKRMDYKHEEPDRKTRYQIKQEEKRKTAELKYQQKLEEENLKHKRDMQGILMMFAIPVFVIIIFLIMRLFGIE